MSHRSARRATPVRRGWKLPVLGLVLALAAGLFAFGGRFDSSAVPGSAAPVAASDTVPGEVLVRFASNATSAARGQAHAAANADVLSTISRLNVDHVRIRPGTTVDQAIAAYRGRRDVVYAEPNVVMQAVFTPNDPSYGQQWGLPKISAPAAWDVTTGSSAVTLAILDTGVDPTHPEFTGRLLAGKNTLDGSTNITDGHGHGTHTTGIASATGNNGIGVAGVSWQNKILPVKVLDDSGSGTSASVASGITWATDQGARVISMSLGGGGTQTLQDATQYALSHNAVVVAAAGNSNSSTAICPACYSNLGVMAVAATDQNDAKASFSNYGSWITIAAPGVSIYSTYKNGGYATMSGTSMATPFVSGAAVLVRALHPDWTATQVRAQLVQTADPITSTYFAAGRLDAGKAVGGTSTPPSPTPTPTPTTTPSPTPSVLQPMTVTGRATVGGRAAPAGSVVTAWVGATQCGQGTVSRAGSKYSVSVNSSTQQAGCGTNGAAVTFTINGVAATPGTTFASGTTVNVNINAP